MPVSVSKVDAPPAASEVGVIETMPGTGLATLSKKILELPPFGNGFTTTICSSPALAISDASILAARVVVLTKPVVRLMPLTDTADAETKFFPDTKSVKPAPPVEAPEGVSDVICGTGLGIGLMINVRASVVPPPGVGVMTVTYALPAFWMSLARICAVSSPVVLKSVLRTVPFHSTEELGVKPEPVTVSVKAGWPASMLRGEIEVIDGAGYLICCWQLPSSTRQQIRSDNDR